MPSIFESLDVSLLVCHMQNNYILQAGIMERMCLLKISAGLNWYEENNIYAKNRNNYIAHHVHDKWMYFVERAG